MDSLFEVLRHYFARYGYWTVAVALLLENAGIPVPGETILLFASFLAFSEGHLHLLPLIVFGTLAATIGDNIGYYVGRRGGRPLLDRYKKFFRISEHTIARGERLFERQGSVAIFFARFIFGMRIIAGPLAGVLRMPWRQFVIFNFSGAAVWVTTISLVGYFFGESWDTLVRVLHRANMAAGVVVVLVVLYFWWRYHKRRRDLNESNKEN